MSDDVRAAKATGESAPPEATSVPPASPSGEVVDGAPQSRRPKPRLSLRIPDDEVSRPKSAAPKPLPAPVVSVEPIAPARIITINPPSSEEPMTQSNAPSTAPRVMPAAPRLPSIPGAPKGSPSAAAPPPTTAAPPTPITAPATPQAKDATAPIAVALPVPPPASPPASHVSAPPVAATPPTPSAPPTVPASMSDAEKTQPRGALGSSPEVAASDTDAADSEMIPVTSSDPAPSMEKPKLASSEAVHADLDEAESAAMLDAVRSPPADDGSVDIPVDEELPPSSDPEIDVSDVVSVESARHPAIKSEPKVPVASPASVPTSVPTAVPTSGQPQRRSFPPPGAIGMSSSPSVVTAARHETPPLPKVEPKSDSKIEVKGPDKAPADNKTPADKNGKADRVDKADKGDGVAPQGGLAPPAMTDAAAARKRGRPWWEELFNDDFLRTMAKITEPQISGECDFIEESLGVAKGAMVLDLACGTGRHAIELTRRGYQVVGFDLSLPMLAKAAEEAQERDQKINFVQGDMREMTFEETFDGVYCWNTSFGFFEEEKNAQIVTRVHKALRQGGQFLLDVANRDYVIKQSPSLCWFEGDGCICMDEMQIDFITSRMRVKRTMMMDDGRSKEIEYSIRLYSLHELGKILHDHGFRVVEVSGRMATPGVFFGNEAPRTLILAEKR